MRRFLVGILLLGLSPMALSADMVRRAPPDSGRHVGVGIGFSGVTGLSVYGDLSRENFVQAGVGFGSYGSYAVTGDYGFGYRNAVSSLPTLTPFWGLGAIVLQERRNYWRRYIETERETATLAGARIPLGVNFVIPKTPVQLAAEIAPTLLVTPASYAYVEGGVNVRVLF